MATADADTIVRFFVTGVRSHPDRLLLRTFDGRRLTYGEAGLQVASLTEQLHALGLSRGDRVVCYLEDTVASLLFDLAAAVQGIVPVPLSPSFSIDYLKGIVSSVGARFVLTTEECAPRVTHAGLRAIQVGGTSIKGSAFVLDPSAAITDERADARFDAAIETISGADPLMIQPTSGSTGTPKLVLRHHHSFVRYARYVGPELALPEGHPQRILLAVRLTHAFGLHMLTLALSLGAEIDVTTQLDTQASLDEVRALDPTTIPTVPRVLRSLCRQHLAKTEGDRRRVFGPSARFVLSAGARSEPEHAAMVKADGLEFIEFYGATECSIVALTPRGGHRQGYAGRLVPDVECNIAEDGEILVRSPGLMRSYVDVASLGAQPYDANGFYRTGDLGEVSADGYLKVRGRARDVFNTPEGSNIDAARIESMVEVCAWAQAVVLLGDARAYITAYIVVPPSILLEYGVAGAGEIDDVLDETRFASLYRRVSDDLERVNRRLETIERVVAFLLFGRSFPTHVYSPAGAKIRRDRKAFEQHYAHRIASLYARPTSIDGIGPPLERAVSLATTGNVAESLSVEQTRLPSARGNERVPG